MWRLLRPKNSTHKHQFQAIRRFSTPGSSALSASHPVFGFTKVSSRDLTEFNARAHLFRHTSGAEVVSVEINDENKTFGVTFATPSPASFGVAHILEHSVLCGSRKFPLKEPFVELLKGSVHTFLNAFTYPDRTCYPVASTNLKDFYNLVDVYLDAVFFPKAVEDPRILRQEGWHYSVDQDHHQQQQQQNSSSSSSGSGSSSSGGDNNNRKLKLKYKGVVYNEMKGVYSDPDSIEHRISQRALFPDIAYRHDSGGDPEIIPQLTFEKFKEFHRQFYQPSNARFWFYGNDDPTKRLEILNEYLTASLSAAAPPPSSSSSSHSKSNSKPPPSSVELGVVDSKKKVGGKTATAAAQHHLPHLFILGEYQHLKDLSNLGFVKSKFAVGSDEDTSQRSSFSMNWLLSHRKPTPEESLSLGVLDYLLLGTQAAPLHRALIQSGLGSSLIGGGLSDELSQATFSVGLKDIKSDSVKEVENVIISTLHQIANDGFDPDALEAAMNTIEFALRENNTGSFPKGLSLMLKSLSWWLYGGDPLGVLQFEGPLQVLKDRLARKEPVFQDLIRQKLLSNKHVVRHLAEPCKTLAQTTLKAEEGRLVKVVESLSQPQLADLQEQERDLVTFQQRQDTPEALATIPVLSVNDIPKELPFIPIERHPYSKHQTTSTSASTSTSSTSTSTSTVSASQEGSNIHILRHDLFTQGINYMNIAFDLSPILFPTSEEDKLFQQQCLPYLGLFVSALKQVGTNKRDFVALQNLIGAKTGGISISTFSSSGGARDTTGKRVIPIGGRDMPVIGYLVFRAKSMVANTQAMLDIIRELIMDVNFNNQERVRQLVAESKADMESYLVSSGSSASTRLDGMYTVAGALDEHLTGVTHYHNVCQLLDEVSKDWPSVLNKLNLLKSRLLVIAENNPQRPFVLNVTADLESLNSIDPAIQNFIQSLPRENSNSNLNLNNKSASEEVEWSGVHSEAPKYWGFPRLVKQNEAIVVPTQVNYVHQAGNLYDTGYKYHASVSVITKLLGRGYLWDRVRVEGGAYGASCGFDNTTGSWEYSSYRDPSVNNTLTTYDNTHNFIIHDLIPRLDQKALDKAIVGTLGNFDRPQLPDQKGYSSMLRYILNTTDEERLIRREQARSTTVTHFRDFAEKLAKLEKTVCVVGSEESVGESSPAASHFKATLRPLRN